MALATGSGKRRIGSHVTDALSRRGYVLFTTWHAQYNEVIAQAKPPAEYAGIYQHFVELLKSGRSHVDATPLQWVSDCFLLGNRVETDAFS